VGATRRSTPPEPSRLLISTGANVVASSPSKSRPSRASRHHVNNWLTDRLYRRAVAETCRRPAWLSATIRCFSANVQRRRAPVEITSRRETFELVPLHNGYDSLAEGNLALIGSG
jgi:hypothetical protein